MTATVEIHLRPRYQCSTCGRSWSKRARAQSHCAECIHDSATRSCATCIFDIFHVGFGEGPGGCALGLRDEAITCVRRCDGWIGKGTLVDESSCEHDSADGIDTAEFGPNKVFCCLICGALFRSERRGHVDYRIAVQPL